MTRSDLKIAVFRLLDRDKNGFLDKKELKPFVCQTGFEGSDDEWSEEYALLCGDLACNEARGIREAQFLDMVDDESDNGCHCSDEELRTMIPILEKTSTIPAEPLDPWAQGSDPWAMPSGKASSKGKGKEKKGKDGKGKGKGKSKASSDEGHDPWSGGAADPWSTPAALKAKDKLANDAKRAGQQDGWGDWRDSGKPTGAYDSAKPVMDAQKLLEASRAALAARKAREREEDQNKQDSSTGGAAESSHDELEIKPPGSLEATQSADAQDDEDDDDDFWGGGGDVEKEQKRKEKEAMQETAKQRP
eukprot:TRINITY_DN13260_c2_g1_i2.p1 TRINITY_DN13260_c2_g1~~TRINITY_DN13260_c2_g1_i2.p1  ORF type:complete len:304 (-),score=98.53 TRINITY_DN13260_c2_g1_i2:6-917(-)